MVSGKAADEWPADGRQRRQGDLREYDNVCFVIDRAMPHPEIDFAPRRSKATFTAVTTPCDRREPDHQATQAKRNSQRVFMESSNASRYRPTRRSGAADPSLFPRHLPVAVERGET